jgi:hypothetical protein
VFAVSVSCSGQKKDISLTAKAVLDKLNSWDTEELSVAECPNLYPGRVASGETMGWISAHKQELRKLGDAVQWNCEKKQYEIVTREQTPSAKCDCKQ